MNLQPRAKREAERSWSTYDLERSERLRALGQPNTSSEARGLKILANLAPRAKREVEGLGQPNTSSEARALGLLVNLLPRAKREAQEILVNLLSRAKREAELILFNLQILYGEHLSNPI